MTIDDKTIDELADGLLKVAAHPVNPPNPNAPTIVTKMTKIKIQRNLSNKKFLEHFKNVPKIIKTITEVKFDNKKSAEDTKKQKDFLQTKRQKFSQRVTAAVKKAEDIKQIQQTTKAYIETKLKQEYIDLPVDVTSETTTTNDNPHLR